MPESGTYGSVRGAAGNSRPYRECRPIATGEGRHRGRRPKASREGTRESWSTPVPQALWRFRCRVGAGGRRGAAVRSVGRAGDGSRRPRQAALLIAIRP